MDYRNPSSLPVDVMHISHFMIYFIFGLLYPKHYKIILCISILWEIFEIIIVNNDILYYFTKTYWIIPEKYWNETITNKIIDVCANFIGYYLGSKLVS